MSSSLGSSRRSSANSRNTTRIMHGDHAGVQTSSSTPASSWPPDSRSSRSSVERSISTASRTWRPRVSVTSSWRSRLSANRAGSRSAAGDGQEPEPLQQRDQCLQRRRILAEQAGVPDRRAGRAAARRPHHGPPPAVGDHADSARRRARSSTARRSTRWRSSRRSSPGPADGCPTAGACRAASTGRRTRPPRPRTSRRRRRPRRRQRLPRSRRRHRRPQAPVGPSVGSSAHSPSVPLSPGRRRSRSRGGAPARARPPGLGQAVGSSGVDPQVLLPVQDIAQHRLDRSSGGWRRRLSSISATSGPDLGAPRHRAPAAARPGTPGARPGG